MKRHFRWVGPLVVLLIFAAAVWLLYGKLREFSYRDFQAGLGQISSLRVAVAAGLTAVYYAILVSYDYLAVRYAGYRLPLGKVALASFTGYACSSNLGLLIGGASVRYRLYSLWGLPAIKIAQVIVVLGLTFWMGVFALGGVVFLARPFAIPPLLHLPFANAWTLGLVLLALLAVYLGLCATSRRRQMKLFGRRLRFPPVALGLAQMSVASVDLMVGAAVFHTLASPLLEVGYTTLLGVYLLSFAAGIATQVPGGMGVFELSILVVLEPSDPAGLMAVMMVWRTVFYLLPLAVAGVVLGLHEVWLRLNWPRDHCTPSTPATNTQPLTIPKRQQ